MKNKNRAILISILAGVCIGVSIADALRGGWRGVVGIMAILLGRWLLGKIANIFFDDELEAAKRKFALKDPVKLAIWRHRRGKHRGRFRDCGDPICNIW